MQIACSSRSFQRDIPRHMSLNDFPAWCGSQGIPLVEVELEHFPSLDHEALLGFRRACEYANVDVVCLAISNDFTIADPALHADQVERVRELLHDVAVPLGAPVMRVFLGYADESRAGDQRALETLRTLVPDLEETGIILAVENFVRVNTTPEQTEALLAGVPTPYVGSCPDFGSLPPARRYEAVRQLAPFAALVHADCQQFDRNGNEVNIDYRRAIAELKEIGYDGVISIVFEGAGDPATNVLAARDLIERLWNAPEQRMAA